MSDFDELMAVLDLHQTRDDVFVSPIVKGMARTALEGCPTRLLFLLFGRDGAEEFVKVGGDRFAEGQEPDARLAGLFVLLVEFLEDFLSGLRRAEHLV